MPNVRHVVIMKLRPETPPEEVDLILAGVAAMKQHVPGFLTSSGGPYRSDEGLHQGFTHAFSVDFDSLAARDEYLAHAEHEPVKQRIIDHLAGGLECVVAFDWEME